VKRGEGKCKKVLSVRKVTPSGMLPEKQTARFLFKALAVSNFRAQPSLPIDEKCEWKHQRKGFKSLACSRMQRLGMKAENKQSEGEHEIGSTWCKFMFRGMSVPCQMKLFVIFRTLIFQKKKKENGKTKKAAAECRHFLI
jgi:hypothetical protein